MADPKMEATVLLNDFFGIYLACQSELPMYRSFIKREIHFHLVHIIFGELIFIITMFTLINQGSKVKDNIQNYVHGIT